MFGFWKWGALLIGLSLLAGAGEVPPPRRVALKVETTPLDPSHRVLLDPMVEALRGKLLTEGCALSLISTEPVSFPLLRLSISVNRDDEGEGMELAVFGWLTEPPAPVKTVASQVLLRDKTRIGEALNRAALAVTRELLAFPERATNEEASWNWILPPALAGITRAQGGELTREKAPPPLEYPWEARVARVHGTVTMDLEVDGKGQVAQVWAMSGPAPLMDAAMAYAFGLRFRMTAELKARAPLALGVAVQFSPSALGKLSKTVLEVVSGRAKATGLQPAADVLRQLLRERLTQEGVTVLDSAPEGDPELRHLRIEVETLKNSGDLCLYAVRGRLSSHADRGLETPSPTHPIRQEGLVAGQRGQVGFQESLIQSTLEVVRSLVDPPNPELLAGKAAEKDPEVLPFDFSLIQVKHQPYPPEYPAYAKQRGVQGTVVLEVQVDEEGRPVKGVVRKGPRELMLSALGHALEWRFEPATWNGKAVKARFQLTMPFKLLR